MKIAAILFAIFLAVIILLADLGVLREELLLLHAIPFGDKIGHFILVGILAYLIIASLLQTLPSRDPNLIALITAFTLAIIFTVEEISQGYFHGRESSWMDLFSNYAGIFFFSIAALQVNAKRKV